VSTAKAPELLTPETLASDLAQLGVAKGDAVMVHASLRRLGPAIEGASTLLDALDLAVGPTGTLMMVLGAEVDHEWVNAHPIAERAALLADVAPYDPLTARALGEVGYLAEAFRVRPGTRVTDNPSGRLAARGHLAEALTRDAPWDDYYGPDSPLHRLCQARGKVLRIGANPDTTTVLHYAEYLADLPHKSRVTRWPESDYFAVILAAYLALGRHRSGTVGRADAHLLDAADIVAFGAEWMTRNLARRRSSL